MSVRKILNKYNDMHLITSITRSKQIKATAFGKHATAKSIKQLITEDAFTSCFKFAFVRNPWDWLVSAYFYIRKDPRDPRNKIALSTDFKKFIFWLFENPAYSHWHDGQLYYIADKVDMLVDYFAKFESFNEEINYITAKILIPTVTVPYVNRTKHSKYQDYYDMELKRYIARVLEKDIDTFHYTF